MEYLHPGQTGQHLEIIVMILEGINSHLRLVLERNFPFITHPLHLQLHQLALRPNTELNTPQGKPDLAMVHPQILLGDGATQDGGFQITNHLPFPTKKRLPEDKRHVNRYVDASGTAAQVSKTLVSAASCTVNAVTLGKSTVGKEK